MQVKVFRAANMKQALRQVKETFGKDALILSTRTVRKQRLGFMRAPELEVTAARENKARAPGHSGQEPKFRQELKTQVSGLSERLAVTYDHSGRLGMNEESGQEAQATSGPGRMQDNDIRSLYQEMRELRRLMTTQAGGREIQRDVHNPAQPEVSFLVDKGVSREAAESIIAGTNIQGSANTPEACLISRCQERLAQWVQVSNGLAHQKSRGKRIVFLGPTGVGKTTTMAKLAAHYLQNQDRDILLVTLDNYRVAAAEQLHIYAQIMGLPLEIVSTPEQLSTVLRRKGVNKLTLIDTAGRNPWDERGLEELNEFTSQGQDFENYLVLSATTRDDDLHGIVDRFSSLGLNGLVFTKMDETRHYAPLVNLQHRTGCPLTYLTAGQRVPEDLWPADPEYISRIIVNPHEKIFHDDQTVKS